MQDRVVLVKPGVGVSIQPLELVHCVRPLTDFLSVPNKDGQGRKLTAITASAPDIPIDLSLDYNWSQSDCISAALYSLMPGDWPRGDFITDLRRHASLSPDPTHPAIGLSGPIPDWAITALLEQADFAFPNVVDLSHGHNSIGFLWDDRHNKASRYVSPSFIAAQCNLLSPHSVELLVNQFQSHLVIACPRLLAIDLIVPILASLTRFHNDLALWVPMSYFSSAPRPRATWLYKLYSAGILSTGWLVGLIAIAPFSNRKFQTSMVPYPSP